jgi:hypothetical protein
MARILVCGAYLADRENCAAAEIREFGSSKNHEVDQRWIALHLGDRNGTWSGELPWTVSIVDQPTPKFTLINRLLEGNESFDYVVIADDDVDLPPQFVDRYVAYVEQFRFVLSQPARTRDSYIDHFITAAMPGIDGRLTRFVEIGPLVCIHRSAFPVLFPFDQRSPMGFGYDFIWPVLLESRGLRIGIIDAIPVAHVIRKPGMNYSPKQATDAMAEMLATTPHLTRADAYTVLEVYA